VKIYPLSPRQYKASKLVHISVNKGRSVWWILDSRSALSNQKGKILSGLFSCRSQSLELCTGFHPGPDH